MKTTPSHSTADVRSFFDRFAAGGGFEQHGPARRLLDYRLGLIRRHARLRPGDVVLDVGCGNGHHLIALAPEIARGIGVDLSPGMIELARASVARAPPATPLSFAVEDAERLSGVADQSVDLALCIGALEHMLDKEAVLASVHRALVPGGRFFLLGPDADYLWYRTIAPALGLATRHLSSDRFLGRDECTRLLGRAGFGRTEMGPWTFIPRGDLPRTVGIVLQGLDALGRLARLDSLRGGLWACAWKE